MGEAEREARRTLSRLRRALEKGRREINALEAVLHRAESEDFPAGAYSQAQRALEAVLDFTEEEERRLRDKVLQTGGLEPGRVRRSSGS